MKYKSKRAANAVRKAFGASPTIVTTSEGTGTAVFSSPLAHWLSKGRVGGPALVDVTEYYVATTKSHKHTKDALWNIDVVLDGYQVERAATSLSFNAMAAAMKNKEMSVAYQAGFTGSSEEIIAQRRNAVPKSNILHLKQ